MNTKVVGVILLVAVAGALAAVSTIEKESLLDVPNTPVSTLDGIKPTNIDPAVIERMDRLEQQNHAAMERIAVLEERLGAFSIAVSSDEDPLSVGPGPAELAAQELAQVSRFTAESPRDRWITEAGLTVDEYDAMTERVTEINRAGFEENWLQRREQYLASNSGPTTQDQLRTSMGDEAYDQFLYASGGSNRVKVGSVMSGSAAEVAGLMSGDLVLSYGDQRVYQFNDLRRLSYTGDVGELVVVEVKRADNSVTQLVLPRGPLGVSGLGGAREVPGG
jgi:hypothetical protein